KLFIRLRAASADLATALRPGSPAVVSANALPRLEETEPGTKYALGTRLGSPAGVISACFSSSNACAACQPLSAALYQPMSRALSVVLSSVLSFISAPAVPSASDSGTEPGSAPHASPSESSSESSGVSSLNHRDSTDWYIGSLLVGTSSSSALPSPPTNEASDVESCSTGT